MNICPGCGGVLGRDCFNTHECQQIAASMNNEASYENDSLRWQLSQAEEENKRLRSALETYVSWNIEESQRMGYYKNHLNSPLYKQGQEALKQQP